MRKLAEVEEAKALMAEAVGWSVMRWLREKKRVRKAADLANAALDRANREAKAGWSSDLQSAYRDFLGSKKEPAGDAALPQFLRRVVRADEEARRARQDAQQTFDEAERQLSTALAREGCKKAIRQWELDEKAIAIAEGGPRS